jgi:photosystem II stability/assembly factor-like uncharacterized protein
MDAFADGPGSQLVAISSGNTPGLGPRGLYRSLGDGAWQEVGATTFGRSRAINQLAIDPQDDNRFAVGTAQAGVFVTSDGGQTFTQSFPATTAVSAMTWTQTRLYVAAIGRGLFASEDGAAWTEYATLRVPSSLDDVDPTPTVPQIYQIREAQGDASHIYVVLRDHLLYHSTDAGATWTSLGGNLVVADPDRPNAWRYYGTSLDASGDRLVVGTLRQGLWRSTDGGVTWLQADSPTNAMTVPPSYLGLVAADGGLVAQADQFGLLRSDDDGVTWTMFAELITNRNAKTLVVDADGHLLLPTYGGGVYVAGTAIPLSETIQIGLSSPE